MPFSPYLEALGWTLLHSCWQGAVLALLYAGARYLLRQQGPQVRYALALGTLLLLPVAAGLTLAWHWPEVSTPTAAVASAEPMDLTGLLDGAGETEAEAVPAALTMKTELTWRERLAAWVPCLPWAWLLGVALMSLRWGTGLWQLQRLRTQGVQPGPEPWQVQLDRWSQSWGLRRRVRLLVSERIGSPATLGFFKPVILMPASLLTGLSPAQWEAILLHELAHIRRADYAIRMIQSLIEILFFYHPLVWWVGKDLAHEREACCDDQAVAACGDALRYAQALTTLQRMCQPSKTNLAMSIQSKQPSFTRRIQRLFEPTTTSTKPKVGLLLTLLLAVSLTAYGWVRMETKNLTPAIEEQAMSSDQLSLRIDRSWTSAKLAQTVLALKQQGIEWETIESREDESGHLTYLTAGIGFPDGREEVISLDLKHPLELDWQAGRHLRLSSPSAVTRFFEGPSSFTIEPGVTHWDQYAEYSKALNAIGYSLGVASLDREEKGRINSLVATVHRTREQREVAYDYFTLKPKPGEAIRLEVKDGEVVAWVFRQRTEKSLAPDQDDNVELRNGLLAMQQEPQPTVSFQIDTTWTIDQLQEKKQALAEQGIELTIPWLRANLKSKRINMIEGSLTSAQGQTEEFLASLGTLTLSIDAQGKVKAVVAQTQTVPEQGTQLELALDHGPEAQLKQPLAHPFRLVIDEHWTPTQLTQAQRKLAQGGIELNTSFSRKNDAGTFEMMTGYVKFPDGSEQVFAVKLGQLIIESESSGQYQLRMNSEASPADFRQEIKGNVNLSAFSDALIELGEYGVGIIIDRMGAEKQLLRSLEGRVVNGHSQITFKASLEPQESMVISRKAGKLRFHLGDPAQEPEPSASYTPEPTPLSTRDWTFTLGPANTSAEVKALTQALQADGYELLVNSISVNDEQYLRGLDFTIAQGPKRVSEEIDAEHYALIKLRPEMGSLSVRSYPIGEGPGQMPLPTGIEVEPSETPEGEPVFLINGEEVSAEELNAQDFPRKKINALRVFEGEEAEQYAEQLGLTQDVSYGIISITMKADADDESAEEEEASTETMGTTSSTHEESSLPSDLPPARKLSSLGLDIQPNPSQEAFNIDFELQARSEVSLVAYDLQGRLVKTIFEGSAEAGAHRHRWLATDQPAGVYLIRLQAGDQVQQRKVILE